MPIMSAKLERNLAAVALRALRAGVLPRLGPQRILAWPAFGWDRRPCHKPTLLIAHGLVISSMPTARPHFARQAAANRSVPMSKTVANPPRNTWKVLCFI